MDPEQLAELLNAARNAIAAGESPDDVARWIQEGTGMSMEQIAEQQAATMRLASGGGNALTDFLHQAAEGALFGQADKLAGLGAALVPGGKGFSEAREDFQQRTDDLQSLAPGASLAAGGAGAAVGGTAALKGLKKAADAIRVARGSALTLTPAFGGRTLPLALPGAGRSAIQALRTLANSPWVRYGTPVGAALEGVRRLF